MRNLPATRVCGPNASAVRAVTAVTAGRAVTAAEVVVAVANAAVAMDGPPGAVVAVVLAVAQNLATAEAPPDVTTGHRNAVNPRKRPRPCPS